MVGGSIVVEDVSSMLEIMGSIRSMRPEQKKKELTRCSFILASLIQMFKEKSVFFQYVIYKNKCKKQDIASIM